MKEPLERILVVEDDTDIQTVGKLALEAVGGFTVQICSSGKEALTAVANYAPNLVLLDVMMPEMDGPTTLGELRKLPATAHTPVIFMTAKVQPHEVNEYLALGAIGVVSKPFDPMTLSDTIRSIWSQVPEQSG